MLTALALSALVTLGPGAFTYAEIAEALTQAGEPTLASANLRNRAAYVSLHNRSPGETHRLLTEALGIAFEPQRSGGWLMVADPAAVARDRRFLLAYRKLAAARFAAIADETTRRRRYADFLSELRMRLDDVPKADLGRARFDVELAQPTTWNGLRALLSSEALAAFEGRVVRRIPFVSLGMPTPAYAPASAPSQPELPGDAPVVQSFEFDLRTGRLTILTSLAAGKVYSGEGEANLVFESGGETYRHMQEFPTFDLPVEAGDVDATFSAMGDEARRYLAGFRSAPPDLAGPPGRRVGSLSEGLQAYPGLEAVMELSPRFETLPEAEPVPSLRRLLVPRWLPGPSRWERLSGILESPGERTRSDEIDRRRYWPWRTTIENGVLIVVNPYTFLDRIQPEATVAALRVERVLATLTPRGREWPAPTWNQAVRLVAAERSQPELPSANGIYRNPQVYPYWTLDRTVGWVQALVPTQREAFWRSLRTSGRSALTTSEGAFHAYARRIGGDLWTLGFYALNENGAEMPVGYEVVIDGRGTLLP